MAATITIRNLDERTQRTLKHRAVDHGISFEAEVRRILDAAANEPEAVEPTGAQLILQASKRFREETAQYGDWELERIVEQPRELFS
ncbi:MAG: hypothetical protein LBR21_03070 [Propionibacteriaceae bacterium]|jgi:plasmid stability protein|nr:hypothetical protein [Propionibacteriaceae bacterium]